MFCNVHEIFIRSDLDLIAVLRREKHTIDGNQRVVWVDYLLVVKKYIKQAGWGLGGSETAWSHGVFVFL